MKRAVILHGTDGTPESNWFPWLKGKLEAEGYQVWVPLLPENHTPNRETYNDFLLGKPWDFTGNIVIGHSSGAVEVLNLLMDWRCRKIKLGVLVSAWEKGTPIGMEDQQFADLFPPEGFDPERIKQNAKLLAFMHSDDDPYVPLEWVKPLVEKLGAPLTVIPNGHHLGSKYAELPELWKILEPVL